jgi:hypothetical protein
MQELYWHCAILWMDSRLRGNDSIRFLLSVTDMGKKDQITLYLTASK